ncbi:MAG: hypothetical protein H0X29_02590 [Parachlamydiaceae bacterium]|nr:hypothetical protein [Parachlamydiaceae bacterium]
MRFIFNFLFFGILFYLIWMFFPDAFLKLVSWADSIVVFFRDLIMGLYHKFQPSVPVSPTGPEGPTVPASTAAFAISWLLSL